MYSRLPGFGGGVKVRDVCSRSASTCKVFLCWLLGSFASFCFAQIQWSFLSWLQHVVVRILSCPGCRLGPAGSLPRGPLAREYLQTSAWAELASAVLLGQHATTSTMDCKAIVSTATANTSQTVYMQNFRCSELGAWILLCLICLTVHGNDTSAFTSGQAFVCQM